jgi:uncharacterized membrane protein
VLVQFGQWLQNNSLVVTLNSTAWMAAATEMLHYFSMFVLVGSTAIVDLRVLGLAARNQSPTQLANRLFPWAWGALALNALSGFVMFAGNAPAYIPNSIFHAKLLAVLLAVLFGAMVQWGVPKWDRPPAMPPWAKVVALVSLLLWVGAIIAGVEVPALTGIG